MSAAGDGSLSAQSSVSMNQQFDQVSSSGLNAQRSEATLHHDDKTAKSGAPSTFGSGDAIADPIAAPTAEQPFPTTSPTPTNKTPEKKNASGGNEMANIETTPVENDPRQWSSRRKVCTVHRGEKKLM
jgi:hypothetical protein